MFFIWLVLCVRVYVSVSLCIQRRECMFICSNKASPSMFHTFRYISLVGSFIHVIWIEDMSNKKKMSWKLHSKWKQHTHTQKIYIELECTFVVPFRSLSLNFFPIYLSLFLSVFFFVASFSPALNQNELERRRRRRSRKEEKNEKQKPHQESQEKQFSALHKQRRAKHVTWHAFVLLSNWMRKRKEKLIL